MYGMRIDWRLSSVVLLLLSCRSLSGSWDPDYSLLMPLVGLVPRHRDDAEVKLSF